MTSALKLPDTTSDEILEIVAEPDPPVTMLFATARGIPGAVHASFAALRPSGVQVTVTAPGPTAYVPTVKLGILMLSPAVAPHSTPAIVSPPFTLSAALPFELATNDWPFTVQVKLSAWPLGDVGLPEQAALTRTTSSITNLTRTPPQESLRAALAPYVLAAPNFTHAPGAERRQHLVRAEACAGG